MNQCPSLRRSLNTLDKHLEVLRGLGSLLIPLVDEKHLMKNDKFAVFCLQEETREPKKRRLLPPC